MIYAIVRENCTEAYSSINPRNDMTERFCGQKNLYAYQSRQYELYDIR